MVKTSSTDQVHGDAEYYVFRSVASEATEYSVQRGSSEDAAAYGDMQVCRAKKVVRTW